jgi:hypothetical protein
MEPGCMLAGAPGECHGRRQLARVPESGSRQSGRATFEPERACLLPTVLATGMHSNRTRGGNGEARDQTTRWKRRVRPHVENTTHFGLAYERGRTHAPLLKMHVSHAAGLRHPSCPRWPTSPVRVWGLWYMCNCDGRKEWANAVCKSELYSISCRGARQCVRVCLWGAVIPRVRVCACVRARVREAAVGAVRAG